MNERPPEDKRLEVINQQSDSAPVKVNRPTHDRDRVIFKNYLNFEIEGNGDSSSFSAYFPPEGGKTPVENREDNATDIRDDLQTIDIGNKGYKVLRPPEVYCDHFLMLYINQK